MLAAADVFVRKQKAVVPSFGLQWVGEYILVLVAWIVGNDGNIVVAYLYSCCYCCCWLSSARIALL